MIFGVFMRYRACVLVLSLFLCFGIFGTSASSPVLPCEFYGTVVIDGTPAPAETEITAYIGDRAAGSIITEESGVYGGTGTFDVRLVVIPVAEELSDGTAVIQFVIGDRIADQTFIFESGHSTELNLTFGEGSSDDVTMMSAETEEETSEPSEEITEEPSET